MNENSAVSTVVGTVLLLVIVVLVAGLCAVALFSSGTENQEYTPLVFFASSTDNHTLYHAGGAALYRDDIRVYAGGVDITANTRVEKNPGWTIWKTGERLIFPGHLRSTITIVYKNGDILY